MRFVVALFAMFCSHQAYADSIRFLAGSLCTPDRLELAAVVHHNNDVTSLESSSLAFRELPIGTHTLNCKVARRNVRMAVRVYGGDNGYCMGAGFVALDELRIGQRKTASITSGTPFNWSCPANKMLVRVAIVPKRSSRQVALEKCYADSWDWDSGYVNLVCKSEKVR